MKQLGSDSHIIERFRKGDERAMVPIFKLYHKGLCYFANQLIHNIEQAEDIVADAFMKLWQKKTDFDELTAIKSFMYVTVRNGCLNHLRHLKRKTESHKKLLNLAETDENYIETKMIKAELMEIVLKEVEGLPPVRRKIFKMIYLEDLSIFEIAEKLQITVDTVRVQKARALHGIRTAILKKEILISACQLGTGLFFLNVPF